MVQPNAYEQYMLELINRARLNPLGEANLFGIGLNDGLNPDTISDSAKQPLAFNFLLIDSARIHSQWMLDTDTFSHTGEGASTPGERMEDAGYQFTGIWTSGENIGYSASTGILDLNSFTADVHQGLFESPGHRTNILSDNYWEIGIGILTGDFNGYNSLMATQNFAKSGSDIFLTGVAFDDSVIDDDFYSIGEGLGGIEVTAVRQSDNSLFSTTTMDAGGYQMKLAPGTYDVTFSGNNQIIGSNSQITIGLENIKLDLDTNEVDPVDETHSTNDGSDANDVDPVDQTDSTNDGSNYTDNGSDANDVDPVDQTDSIDDGSDANEVDPVDQTDSTDDGSNYTDDGSDANEVDPVDQTDTTDNGSNYTDDGSDANEVDPVDQTDSTDDGSNYTDDGSDANEVDPVDQTDTTDNGSDANEVDPVDQTDSTDDGSNYTDDGSDANEVDPVDQTDSTDDGSNYTDDGSDANEVDPVDQTDSTDDGSNYTDDGSDANEVDPVDQTDTTDNGSDANDVDPVNETDSTDDGSNYTDDGLDTNEVDPVNETDSTDDGSDTNEVDPVDETEVTIDDLDNIESVSDTNDTNEVDPVNETELIGEFGNISNLNHNSQTIQLNNSYDNPVVFALPLSRNGRDPAIARITDIQDDNFSLFVQEAEYKNGRHKKESLSYLVLEAGTWELEDGTMLEVGTLDTDSITTSEWEGIDFATDFLETPAILSQVQTYNDSKFVRTRQTGSSADGFQLAMEEEEALKYSGHGTETVGWLAMESGIGSWDGLDYQVGHTGTNINHTWDTINFSENFEEVPSLFASLASYNGSNSAGLRYRDLEVNQVEIKVEEDRSLDKEIRHGAEMVDFLAIAGSGDLSALAYEPIGD